MYRPRSWIQRSVFAPAAVGSAALTVLLAVPCVIGCKPNAVVPPTATDSPPAAASPSVPPAGATEDVKAGVGVGAQGRSLDGHSGLIVTPAKTLFAAKEKIVFEIAIPHALNLYNAAEGNYPRSHDEFMERVVRANNIVLPKLPEGNSYVYDPETYELMVRRPVAAANGTK
ncbi:MAG: hypothetical protein FJ295_12140 [Planctomycetes bacterium]|nr:hypothetical protein [Planctomycetota bacterium]